mgnify:CR=1 FL=1
MKVLRRHWLAAAVLVVLAVCGAAYMARPRLQAERFVARHGAELEEQIQTGGTLPEDLDVTLWDGERPMAEVILFAWGDTYYGCYYSPDGVPLPFQNAGLPLHEEKGGWSWATRGDNHGFTAYLEGNWYYFEASF